METSVKHLSVVSTDFEPPRSMDRYLDSLFDPVLSDGIEVCYVINQPHARANGILLAWHFFSIF